MIYPKIAYVHLGRRCILLLLDGMIHISLSGLFALPLPLIRQGPMLFPGRVVPLLVICYWTCLWAMLHSHCWSVWASGCAPQLDCLDSLGKGGSQVRLCHQVSSQVLCLWSDRHQAVPWDWAGCKLDFMIKKTVIVLCCWATLLACPSGQVGPLALPYISLAQETVLCS